MPWLLLILSMPTQHATARMRAWRALKASGTAVLRDGVYLLPAVPTCRQLLDAIREQAVQDGAIAYLLDVESGDPESLRVLFDRSTEFADVLADIQRERDGLSPDNAAQTVKQARKLRKAFSQVAATDYFPGECQHQVRAALEHLEAEASRALAVDEPAPVQKDIEQLAVADFQGRIWATRTAPWVDRLASAWLIARFIDREATFVWIATPADCPPAALGFDFDGARFSHVDARVTFETLLDSFDIRTPALNRVAALVHYLDAGGIEPPEANGVERVLAGLRDTQTDDDRLLAMALMIFDGLLAAFVREASA